MENIQRIPELWKRVKDGEFQIVYATPETILKASGYFMKDIFADSKSPFMQNLVAVAIDECHLVNDWLGFREQYGDIGPLRSQLAHVPFIGLSATLTPNFAAYVHRVCRLNYQAVSIDTSIRRDNINLVVARMEGDSIEPLINSILGKDSVRALTDIRKTLIFHDGVNKGIDIANELIARLPSSMEGVDSSVTIANYFGDLDALSKTTILQNVRSGSTRVVICTDAFGLGIDVEDIEVVIQWGVSEKLIGSTLAQRIGRAARDPQRMGVAVVYVQSFILDYINREGAPEGWKEAWAPEPDHGSDNGSQTESQPDPSEEEHTGLGVVPLGLQLNIQKFGLPVSYDTAQEVSVHLRTLYRDVKSLREVFRETKKAMQGTKEIPVPMAKKLDPPVLWFICTTGCRHMVLGSVFQDTNLFQRTHRGWCCDTCVYSAGTEHLSDLTVHGISPRISILNREPQPPTKRQTKNKVASMPDRYPKPAPRIEHLLRIRLRQVRSNIWEHFRLPGTDPCIVLPDEILEKMLGSICKIGTPDDLGKVLLMAGVDHQLSLLEDAHINAMLTVIKHTMLETLPPVHILPRPRAPVQSVPLVNAIPVSRSPSLSRPGRSIVRLSGGVSAHPSGGSTSSSGASALPSGGSTSNYGVTALTSGGSTSSPGVTALTSGGSTASSRGTAITSGGSDSTAIALQEKQHTDIIRNRPALEEIQDNGQLSKRPRRLKRLPWRIRNE